MVTAVMPTYARTDVVFERGEGAFLFDAAGRRFLDFHAGIAVSVLGHCHPHLVSTLQAQAGQLWHTSNVYRIAEQERLAQRLVAATFADMFFFTNSGAEAWEGGIKLIRKFQSTVGQPKRWRVITVEGAFHGRTLAGIAAAKTEKMIKGFGPMVDGFDQVAFGNLNELRAAITDETAGICVEPVLGDGGIKPASLEYLQQLRAVCDEFGLLLMFDEIQVGYGRSGKLFAHEWADIVPDVICIAKGMGGGFPIGAFGATEHAAQGMVPGTHGSTYGGNPLGCAVGNAVLDVLLGDGFLAGVDRTARALWGELLALQARHPGEIETVRGAGLMLGVKTNRPNIDVVNALREHSILTVPAGDNVVRLLPPLIIGSAEIATLINAFDQIFAAPSAA